MFLKNNYRAVLINLALKRYSSIYSCNKIHPACINNQFFLILKKCILH